MLIAKVYVNYDQIDEIWIQNTGKVYKPGFYTYQIIKPEGIKAELVHERSAGYQSLLIMALSEISYKEKKK